MRCAPLLFVIVACSGGDDAETPRDDGGNPPSPDAPPDARIPITSHRGLVQAVTIGSNPAQLQAGFYETPTTAPGCAWTYVDSCSFAACASSGIVATDAGVITLMGTSSQTQATLTPTNAQYSSTSAVIAPGVMFQASAAGNAVPAFTAGPITMPSLVSVTAPTSGSMVSRSAPMTLAWTPGAGDVYVNLSQTANSGPYPASHARTIRCTFPSQAGTAVVPVELVGQLETTTAQVVIAGVDVTTIVTGAYEVDFRAIALDTVRQITVIQ